MQRFAIVNVDNDGEDGDGGICVNLARDLQWDKTATTNSPHNKRSCQISQISTGEKYPPLMAGPQTLWEKSYPKGLKMVFLH